VLILGLEKSCQHSENSNQIELIQLADQDGFNILKLCAEEGEVKCVEILLELNIFDDNISDIFNAQSRAQHNKHFEVLTLLIMNNYTYPLYMTEEEYPEKLNRFIKISEDIHKAVLSENFEKVDTIIKENPKVRYFYNKSNESVLKMALNQKLFNIYEILLAHDVIFGPHEQFGEIFNKLSENEKTILREIHFKYSKDLPENHINILMMNTQISHDDTEKEGKKNLVLRAYNVLNKDPLINPILKVVSASKHFGIIFDFKRPSVEILDPTAAPHTRGLFYVDGKICIGAKQLLDPTKEHETFGTLAHELCHYAMNLTYKNRAKPYLKHDQINKEKFKKILEFCKDHKEREEIISLVFTYEQHFHSAELIVRVAHLLAMYHNQHDKLKELREIFANLFEYHTDVVIPAMDKALPAIKAKADKEIKEKDKKISKLKLFLFISIGLGIVIACLASWYFYKPFYVYNDLSVNDQKQVQNAIVSYKNINVKFNDLFPNNASVYGKLTSDHIEQMLYGQTLNFSDPQLHYLDKEVSFSWSNMTEKLVDKFLSSSLKFQAETVKFRELNESCAGAFSYLNSEQIISVLNNEKAFIGERLKSDADFYLDRDFLPEDTRLLYFEYEFGHDYVNNITIREEYKANRTRNITFEYFHSEFLKLSFDTRFKIYDKVRQNVFFKSYYYDLNSKGFHLMYKNSTEIVKQVDKEKLFILSSEAGAGKTVTFEHLAIEIKRKFPTRWVTYIDLKDHTQFYKTSGSPENVHEFLKKILRLGEEKNKFEVRIFEESFKSGLVVLVWNGFDEISPTYNEFILNLFQYIQKNTRNIQLVCTRPLYSDQLCQTLKTRSYQLLPFNNQTRKMFFTEFYIFKNISSEETNAKIKRVEEIMNTLNFEKLVIAYKFQTPLMLRLLAEIPDNQTLLESGNIYGIYKNFVEKKIGFWLDRSKSSHDVVKKLLLSGSLKLLFQKYALLNEFQLYLYTTLGLKMKKLHIMQKDIPKGLTREEISTMGILYIDGKNKFEFAHKTFAEFFIAEYFIENVHDIDGYVSNEEAELRLELFCYLNKNYGYGHEKITDFMNSYLQLEPNEIKSFNPTISELLRTKFKNLLFRMLDTNHPTIFGFLFDFFKKDHGLFVDLLHVHEDETFYTAIFNQNNFAIFTNPLYVKELAQNLLTNKEFLKFLSGKNQRGKILLGIQFYKLIGATKSNDAYNNESNSLGNISYWDSFHKISKTLTSSEKKHLIMTALIPKIYFYYDEEFNNSDISEYKNLWTGFENLMSKNEMPDFLGNILLDYIEIFPYSKPGHELFFPLLLEKVEYFLSSSQIYEMFLTKSILHEDHHDLKSFKALWDLLEKHTNFEQRQTILTQDDHDDKNFYFYAVYDEQKLRFSKYRFLYYHYDFTPFKIFHRSMIVPNAPTFNFTKEVYEKHFNNTEIQKIFNNTSDLLYYVTGRASEASCVIITAYFEKLYDNDTKSLTKFLERKIKPTNFSVFELIDDFRGFPYYLPNWFQNIEIFSKLYYKIKDL